MNTIFIWLILLVAVLAACGPAPSWEGTVYPDRHDLTTHVNYGSFDSVGECLRAGEQLAGDGGTFECGYDCKPMYEGSVMDVCDETAGPSDTSMPPDIERRYELERP